jgi:hypothetical protein
MKLDQKQMMLASQLFMAAGKAGQPFDLARFSRESAYASEVMANLAAHSSSENHPALQSLVAIAMDALSTVQLTRPAPLAAFPTEPSPPSKAESQQKYVGQLR